MTVAKHEGARHVENSTLREHERLTAALVLVRSDTCTVPNCRVPRAKSASTKTDNDPTISIIHCGQSEIWAQWRVKEWLVRSFKFIACSDGNGQLGPELEASRVSTLCYTFQTITVLLQ